MNPEQRAVREIARIEAYYKRAGETLKLADVRRHPPSWYSDSFIRDQCELAGFPVTL